MKKPKKWTARERSSSQQVLDVFKIGDRVTLIEDLKGMVAGIEGKIVRGITNEYYPVLWEGRQYPYGMYPDQIALVEASELFPELDPYA